MEKLFLKESDNHLSMMKYAVLVETVMSFWSLPGTFVLSTTEQQFNQEMNFLLNKVLYF